MTKRKVCFSFCENRGQMNTDHCSCNCYVSMSFSRSLSQLALPYHLPRQSNKAQEWGWTLSRSFGLLRLAHLVGAAHLVVPKAGHPTMLGPTQQFWQHVVWLCVGGQCGTSSFPKTAPLSNSPHLAYLYSTQSKNDLGKFPKGITLCYTRIKCSESN